jgi:predicted DNA binding protein
MSLIAEYRLSSPKLPLMGSLAAVPEVTLHVEHEHAENPQEPTIFVWADGERFDTFESELETDESVKSVAMLERLPGRRLYRIQISSRAEVVMYPAGLEVGAAQLAVSATHEGLEVRQRFPDHDALRRYCELCREREVVFSLHRLYSLSKDEPSFDTTYGLSQKQCETLQTAVEAGYFDVPRDVQLSDLASSLGVSSQSVSERLRRGTATLVRQTLAADGDDPSVGD